MVRGEQGALEVAINLPYYVRPGDIYSQIMGQQQAAPRTLADYYPGFTGGYDTSLYAPKKQAESEGGGGTGLLDLGGGMGGDLSAMMGSTANPADTIALGQALSSYGRGLGVLGPGGALAGLLGPGLVSAGISALGEMEASQAAQEAAANSMAAVAADAAAAADMANAFGVADAVGMSGFGDIGGFGGYGAADGVGMSGFGDAGGFGGFGGGDGGFGGGDSGGGFGGGDGGFAKGGKVTMRGLLVDETLPGPDDGYAALQAGEYVIKKSTTKKLGDKKLQALNEGRASIKMRKE